jgi:exopolyphosphatase/pppGpp-phosphohydrolase
VDRVVVAVNKAMSAARQLGVQQLYVCTTSAVRDAANRDLILDRVEAEAGVRPQYLSGEDEARLTYLAVHQWYGWSAGRLLWEGVPERAIGASKTFKQLARLTGAPAQRKGPFVRRRVTARDIDTWIPRLAALQAQERARLQGISRSRGRQIVAGAMVARATMKSLNVGAVDVCPWALREGIILHYLQTTFNQPLDLPLRPLTGSAYEAEPLAARRQLDGARRRPPRPGLTGPVSAGLDG